MCSVCLCVCWRRGSGRREGRGRTRDWYRTRERWTRWKRRGGVGGSKGLVPQQVKSIFLTSSSTTAPLSLDECWLGRVCLCPLPKSTKTATLLQKFTQGLHKKLFYSDCPLKKKKKQWKTNSGSPKLHSEQIYIFECFDGRWWSGRRPSWTWCCGCNGWESCCCSIYVPLSPFNITIS